MKKRLIEINNTTARKLDEHQVRRKKGNILQKLALFDEEYPGKYSVLFT